MRRSWFLSPTINAYLSNIRRSVALGLLGSQPESDRLASAARWRTACLNRGHKLVSHAEQVSQDIWCDTRETNQYGTVAEIVVGYVVNIGSGCEQFGAVLEAHAKHQRIRLSRAMGRHARHEFSANLERGCPVGCARLHAGQRQADLLYGVEVNCASRHGRMPLSARTGTFSRQAIAASRTRLCRPHASRPRPASRQWFAEPERRSSLIRRSASSAIHSASSYSLEHHPVWKFRAVLIWSWDRGGRAHQTVSVQIHFDLNIVGRLSRVRSAEVAS